MNAEDAIKEIKRWTGILMSAGSQCVTNTAEAQEMAISALKKQIPQKPKEKHYEEPGEAPIIKRVCPCGCKIQPMQSSNYCRICGQALDWSD